MLPEEVIRFVNSVRLGFVASVNTDGSPNLSPKGTLLALDSEHLFFFNIASPGTVRNLLINPNADVNVVHFFRRKGYRFSTTATVVKFGDKFEKAFEVARELGIDPGDYAITEVVILKVLDYAPVYSPAYDIGKKEEELVAYYKEYYGKT